MGESEREILLETRMITLLYFTPSMMSWRFGIAFGRMRDEKGKESSVLL